MPAAVAIRQNFGWKKDPTDARDRKFSALAPKLKIVSADAEYRIFERTPISDQYDVGSCVANAGCDAFEIIYGLEYPTQPVPQLSRLYAYWIARLLTGDTTRDEGTYLRSLFAQFTKIGVCLETSWPYGPHDMISVHGVPTERVFAPPGLKANMEADSNKFTGYYSIDTVDEARLDNVEAAVRADHPVVFGTALASSFGYADGNTVLRPPANDNEIAGRHAMIVTGVRWVNGRREFYWRNSWGENWGVLGHIWVDQSYMTYSETGDLWVPTRIDPFLAAA